MRRHLRYAAALGLAMLSACSEPRPPVGRWEGAHEDGGLMIVARLEIEASGGVRVSAPNAIADFSTMAEVERAAWRIRLREDLDRAWPAVTPRRFDFDGQIFRRPGGVAPQFEWDARTGRMALIFYSTNRPSVRFPLDPVETFD